MSLSRIERAGLAAVTALWCYYFWYFQAFVWDDAYITLTYARNLLAGEGLSWSGQRVEGYSNFLFVLLIAGLRFITHLPYEWLARGLNVGALLSIIWMLWRQQSTPLLRAVALLLGGCSLPLAAWVFGGLESVFFAALCLLALQQVLSAWEQRRLQHPLHYAAIWLALILMRPEGLMVAGLASLSLLPVREWRRWCVAALLSGFGLLLYLAWKWHYYGELLPNTYYAKLGHTTSPILRLNSYSYLLQYLSSLPLFTVYNLAGVFYLAHRRVLQKQHLLVLGWVCVYGLYVLLVSADYMPYFRFVLPMVVWEMALILRLLATLLQTGPARFAREMAALIGCCALLQPVHLDESRVDNAVLRMQILERTFTEHGVPAGSVIALNAAGYLPFAHPEYRYIDMLGLNDAHIAHAPLVPLPQADVMAGHMKADGAYVLAQQPDVVLFSYADGAPRWNSDWQLMALPGFQRDYKKVTILQSLTPDQQATCQRIKTCRAYLEGSHIKLGFYVRKDRLSWFRVDSAR